MDLQFDADSYRMAKFKDFNAQSTFGGLLLPSNGRVDSPDRTDDIFFSFPTHCPIRYDNFYPYTYMTVKANISKLFCGVTNESKCFFSNVLLFVLFNPHILFFFYFFIASFWIVHTAKGIRLTSFWHIIIIVPSII